jgi:ssDNA-binding replication factor A large subunit
MNAEEIIQQILSEHPEVSRDQILENLETERNKTDGLIEDETLLRLIAARCEVVIIPKRVNLELSISDLVSGLWDVSIIGRVVVVYPPKTYKGKHSGKFAHLTIADENATLRVVLWNDKVNFIESGELEAGQVVRFSHGYTREGRKGELELHLGSKSQIEIEPSNIKPDECSCRKFAKRIN